MLRQRWFGVLGVVLCVSCAASGARVVRIPAERVDVPDAVGAYSTDATPGGVVGGNGGDSLAANISAELAKRGTSASPDGQLAAAATWILHEMNSGRTIDLTSSEAAARRFGFAGVIVSMAGFGTEADGEVWRDALARVPPNMAVNRFGISVSNSGRSAAVVFGAVEVAMAPITRHPGLNEPVELRGEVAARYSSAHVYLTKVDGTVEEKHMPTRKVDASYSFAAPGRYELEVMGDGASGPVIVYNVPLYVGVEEEALTASAGHVTSPAEGEARMFELLNQTRKAAGLNALQADDELRQIALLHSTDMAEHNFFGHVSPTTGNTEDRERRSGVIVTVYGENVAEAETAEGSFDGLMASTGHRANMLNSQFTHVGIAGVSTDAHQLVFTLIFGRRVNPRTMPQSAAEVEAAFLAMRAKKGLSAPISDPLYRAAADAGVAAYVADAKPTPDVAVRAENEALAREVQRAHSSRAGGCSFLTELLELNQLEQNSSLLAPGLRRFGVGARIHKDEHGPRLTVMMILEGIPCH
ncbi:MAG TPA: CAP domain-containing protein [Polyangiaceae bacterium]|nr:CAP domain-containing protein [Polyangiaceae bacterium]